MHKLLTDSPGKKMLLLGNEAIARGAIEAGVAFATTYPGTPSSEISLNLFQISQESDLYFEYSTNEKVALEVASAAANSGVRTFCMMKHVGLNVAADPLMTLAYVGVKAGMVVLTADDPFMFSSQNEQDNRYYGKLSGLPVLEPSSVEEARRMMAEAFDLSEQLGEPVIFRTTTRVNHSSAFVELGKLTARKPKGDFTKDPFNLVTVPAVSRRLHVRLLENWEKARKLAEALAVQLHRRQRPLGHCLQRRQLQLCFRCGGRTGHRRQNAGSAPGIFSPGSARKDQVLSKRLREGAGGRRGRARHGRDDQSLCPGRRTYHAHCRQRRKAVLAAQRIRSGPGAPGHRRLLRGCSIPTAGPPTFPMCRKSPSVRPTCAPAAPIGPPTTR